MSAAPIKVGYIGMGNMGRAMALNALKAGFPVVVYNRTASKCDELVSAGAKACKTPADVAAEVDVVFTNVSTPQDVHEVVFGKNGVAEGIRPGSIFVDNSTIPPAVAKEIAARLLAEKQVHALDAPVSGGDIGARNGTLTIMVGGDAAALARVMPVLEAMGKKITRIGDSGAGQVCKAANQIMAAAQMVALGEILVFSEKCGVEAQKVCEAIKGGAAQCWVLDNKPQQLLAGNRQPGGRAALHSKDMGIVLDIAREHGVPTPLSAITAQLLLAQVESGEGDLDNSAVVGVLERMAGCKISEPLKDSAAPSGGH